MNIFVIIRVILYDYLLVVIIYVLMATNRFPQVIEQLPTEYK